MPLPALAGLGISVGSKLLSGLFGGKSKKKEQQADNKAKIAQAELKNQMGEDTRTSNAAVGSSLLGQAGSDFALDPAVAAQLQQRRSYDFSRAVPEAGAGIGSGLLSGLFGSVADIASQYGINESSSAPMSSGQAGVPMQETVGVDETLYDDEDYKGLS